MLLAVMPMKLILIATNLLLMLTEEQTKDIEFCKTVIITYIGNTIVKSDKLKEHLPKEVLMSIVHLKIFRDCFKEKQFENIEEAWRFMRDDMNSIVAKIFYANEDIKRVEESLKNKE